MRHKRPKYRPGRPVKKKVTAQQTIAACLLRQKTKCKVITKMRPQQRLLVLPPVSAKVASSDGATSLPKGLLWTVTNMKYAKTIIDIAHHSSCRAREQRSGSGFRQRGPFRKIDEFPPSSIQRWRPRFAPATHPGSRMERAQNASSLEDFRA